MSEKKYHKEIMKKSAFTAKSIFDYQKLIFTQPYLLDMILEEKKEELEFTYVIENHRPMTELGSEDILTILGVLMNLQALQQGLKEYSFSLQPENLYYDIDRKVYAKVRDIYPSGRSFDVKNFLEDYQALVGSALQKRYTYEDYKKGGLELLGKHPLGGRVRKAQNPEEVWEVLLTEYRQLENNRREKQRMLPIRTYKTMVRTLFVMTILSAATLGYLGYSLLLERPYTKAVIAADNAYIQNDYVGCIDALGQVEVTRLQHYQKFILANSYIHSENLSQKQKENVIANLSMKDTPMRLEYWIYLGRGEAEQAIEIALQQSDDEMLFYAYMKQRAAIESDVTLKGSEKTSKLEEIDSKLKSLKEKYPAEEKE